MKVAGKLHSKMIQFGMTAKSLLILLNYTTSKVNL